MSGQTYNVTAFYDTRQGAEEGADLLKREGFASSSMDIVHAEDGIERAHEDGGFMHKLSNMFMPDDDRQAYAEGVGRGGYVLSVHVPENEHQRVVGLLDTEHSVDMEKRSGTWREEGWGGTYEGAGTTANTGVATAAGTTDDKAASNRAAGTSADGDRHIDVAEERLNVGKRDVSHGKVNVRSYTVTEDVSADVTLESEHADVQRRAVDRVVDGADADAVFEDKEIVVEERAEEAVASKEAHVVEEIDVKKEVDRETETVTDTVRHTEVDITRGDGSESNKV